MASSTITTVIVTVPDISAIRSDGLLNQDPSMQGGEKTEQQQKWEHPETLSRQTWISMKITDM